MKTRFVLLLTLALLPILTPLTAQAKPIPLSHVKANAVPMYACAICHHQVTAAEAKTLHYTCPKDHGKLLPVKPAAKPH